MCKKYAKKKLKICKKYKKKQANMHKLCKTMQKYAIPKDMKKKVYLKNTRR